MVVPTNKKPPENCYMKNLPGLYHFLVVFSLGPKVDNFSTQEGEVKVFISS